MVQGEGPEFKPQYQRGKKKKGGRSGSSRYWWFVPVIPATWEAKIGRMEI
jgi:hypothetical protein